MSKSEELSIDMDIIHKIVKKYISKRESSSDNWPRRYTDSPIEYDMGRVSHWPEDEDMLNRVGLDYTGNPYTPGTGGSITCSFRMKNNSDYLTIRIFYSEYLMEEREKKIKSIGVTLGDRVRERINEYLGFNSDDFFPNGALVRVFGGAVRDSICEREIHDIDMLVGSKSLKYVENILDQNGYKYIESMTPKDLSRVYSDLKIINEPHSWVKGDKIVQLIRPATGHKVSASDYQKSFNNLIRNVDISCCGVSYDGDKLYENYQNAVSHCRNGIFIVNKKSMMYHTDRITHRRQKLTHRGWEEVKDELSTKRDIKIDLILNKNNVDFVPEWKDNLYYGVDVVDSDIDWI